LAGRAKRRILDGLREPEAIGFPGERSDRLQRPPIRNQMSVMQDTISTQRSGAIHASRALAGAKPKSSHIEHHRTHRSGWLRAAVLGANDGIVSTASLLLGVAAAHATRTSILLAGASGLVAGAMAMAAGEYVSVSSQADTERADLAQERKGLEDDHEAERTELAEIYERRGLEPALAREVANQLMAHDALAAHARDELGISEALRARPFEAALASAASFTAGAIIPLLTAVAVTEAVVPAVAGVSLVSLASLGGLAARAGGARITVGALRVLLWGSVAMGLTAAVGSYFG